ncbi:RNA polymerase sigma factor [Microbulbifer taiwanensis]|uniref:RNA polymerase sigma factor n=1 Tax=Microbulbifer taiwanensis TaxID=986746 RepID=A0ABW1YND1_9GAMM|nr:RNA polymerase sigma factor [Microbulbifer taiwanensis]
MSAWLIQIFQRRRCREDRFVALVSPHIRRMHRMAYRWTASQVEAEDLVQEVLASLVSRVAELEAVEKLGPWLVKVLYRRFVDLYRRRRLSPIDQSVAWGDDEYCEVNSGDDFRQLDLRRALERALRLLDEDWRDIVLLHDVEGYTAIEVAEVLEISVGTVKSRLHRARQKLKKILTQGTIETSRAC